MSQSTSVGSKSKEVAQEMTAIAIRGDKSLYEDCCIEVGTTNKAPAAIASSNEN